MLSPKVHNFDGFLELYEANAGLLSATEIASKIAAIKTATSLGELNGVLPGGLINFKK